MKTLLRFAAIFLALICLFFLAPFSLQAQWEQVGKPNRYIGVPFKAGGKLFVTANGSLFRSDDNGLSWVRVISTQLPQTALITECYGNGNSLYCIFRSNSDKNLLIYRSLNLGQSWQAVQVNYSQAAKAIAAYPGGLIIAREYQTQRLRDSEQVATLVSISPCCNPVLVVAGDTIWMGSTKGLRRTTNEGISWDTMYTNVSVTDLAASGKYVLMGASSKLYRSEDAGKTWTIIDQNWLYKNILNSGSLFFQIINQTGKVIISEDALLTSSTFFDTTYTTVPPASVLEHHGYFLLWLDGYLVRKYKTGTDWQIVHNGITPTNSIIVISLSSFEDILISGDVFYPEGLFSKDYGFTWGADFQNRCLYSITRIGGFYYALSNCQNGVFRSSGDLRKWEKIANYTNPNTGNLNSIAALGDTLVIFNTYNKHTRYSLNGGFNWSAQKNLPAGLSNVFVANGRLYAMKTGTSDLYSTDNAGEDWHVVSTLPPPAIQQLARAFFSMGKLYLWASQGIYVSPDTGKTWTLKKPLYQGNPVTLLSVRGTELGLFAKSPPIPPFYERLLYSPDDGATWLHTDFPTALNYPSGPYTGVGKTIFAVDSMGHVWRNSNFNKLVYTAAGKCYLDENNNGIWDAGELPAGNILIGETKDGLLVRADSNGAFNLYFYTPVDTLKAVPPSPYALVNPPFIPLNGSTANLTIGIYHPPGFNDLELSLSAAGVFRPGFSTNLLLNCKNQGSQPSNGALMLLYDNKLQFIHSNPPPDMTTDSSLFWNINALEPLDNRSFTIRVKTPPDISIGETVRITAEVLTTDDKNPQDNTAVLEATVVNSFDPNDKVVSPGYYSIDSLLTRKPLAYQVRFQNTGNYPASRVNILDTLSAMLEASSFQILAASHPFTWSVRGPGILSFVFDNINLPDSSANEPDSHGFILFSVAPKVDLKIGDMILNQAHIYFDFNLPITTNAVETVIQNTVLVTSLSNIQSLKIAPNPSTGQVRIKTGKSTSDRGLVRLFDNSGQLVYQALTQSSEEEMSLGHLTAGVYWVIWIVGDQVFTGKLVIHKS